MSRFVSVKLREITHLITDGKHGDCENETNSGYYFISAKDVRNWTINYDNVREITKADFLDTHRRTRFEIDDVVVVSTGANIGDIALAKDKDKTVRTTFQKSVAIIKTDKTKADPHFIAYFLNNSRTELHNVSSGSAQKNLLLKDLRDFKINLPSLPTQKRIASILSAYDDLIENNLKRIKLLEEIAQRTYEEWFVKFRVNGEQLPMDEATGLPLGWKQITVNDYAEVIGKGPSLNYDFQGQKYPVINQSCVRNGEIELEKVLYAQELNANKEYCYLKTNDILINSMGQGTLGRVSKNVSIRNERFIIHNCITFLRAKKELSQFQLYYFISSKQSYLISVSQGSTGQTTLKQSLVGDLEIILPTNSILNSFNNIIEPIWNQMGVLKNQNSSLKQSRDILLPRLMNGTINVESK